MTAARNYSSIAAAATLTSGCSNVDTTLQVDTVAGFPSQPYILCLDKDRVGEELVLVTAAAGTTLTVTRGYAGTSAVSHSAGATVRHVFTGKDAQEAADHVGDETAHGLYWAWARPGGTVPGMVTGTPVAVSAGPTTILSGPASGRRVLKHLLVSGPQGAIFTLSVAGVALYANQLSPSGGNQLYTYQLTVPIGNAETVQATVSAGTCVFTPVYGDRADTVIDRRGFLAGLSASAASVVPAGSTRTFTQILVGNTTANTAVTELLIDANSITGRLSIPPRTLVTIDDPIAITGAQALKYKGDGANSLTYLAVGI